MPSLASAHGQEVRMYDVGEVAHHCEQLWNNRGKAAAEEFVNRSVDVEMLRGVLKDGDSLARTKALYVMSLLPHSQVLEDFGKALRDDECPIVRHEAAYYLGIMHTPEAALPLGESLLNDPSELVRHESAEALGELGNASGLKWLRRASNDSSELVRRTIKIAELHIALKTDLE
jgi:HEAT repeat protein